jgi:hypothetical protein
MKYPSDDIRQMAWDSLLIKGWHNESRMGNLVDMYKIDGHTVDFLSLRRFPHQWDLLSPTKVFVARYIPALSEKLWNEDKDIMFWLMMRGDNCNRQEHPSDAKAVAADRRERVRTCANIVKKQKDTARVCEMFAKYRKSNQWSVVK